MDETTNNVLSSNNPNIILGPPPGYPDEPQFTNPTHIETHIETHSETPSITTSPTNSNNTPNNYTPSKPVKVLIKNTFITISSDTPPSTTRNRTQSDDTIRLGPSLNNYLSEYVFSSKISTPKDYTLKPTPSHNMNTNKPTITDLNTPEDESMPVSNMIINSSPNSPASPRDIDEIGSPRYSSTHTPSIPFIPHTPTKTPQMRYSSPLYAQFEPQPRTSKNYNPNMPLPVDENDTRSLNFGSGNTEMSAEELYKNRLKRTQYKSPISPDNKFETKPVDPNIIEIVRDSSLKESEPDVVARQLASKNVPLSELPICNNGFSTVMLRNIPNKYTQNMMMNVIDEYFRFLYDFFYLPIDFRNKCNVGYAFINFIHPYFAELFWQKFDHFKLNAFKSNKVCAVTWGRVQGLKANIETYRNSAVMSVSNPEYKPMLLDKGVEVPWPSSNRPIPEVKLRTKKN